MHQAMDRRAFALIAALALLPLGAAPAAAQFGSIFGNPPPRPPANVPSAPPVSQDERYPQRYPSPSRDVPPETPLPPGPPPGVQSQPLPPPSGGVAAPVDTRPLQANVPPSVGQPDQGSEASRGPLPGLPPGQRQPRGTPQPADTSPQPGDEVVTEPPSQKIENRTAVFSGLDKITGRIINFDVAIDETVQFGALQVTPRACYTRPPTETSNTDGFVAVDEVTLQGEVRRIFTGWMFAASPGLHAVEHPIYDVWLTDCKNPLQPKVAEQPEPPKPATAPAARAPQKPAPRPARPTTSPFFR
jgi:hypothetical protein